MPRSFQCVFSLSSICGSLNTIIRWLEPIRWSRGYWVKVMHKTLLRIWLVFWVLTLPLIHIHPEADHAHGASDHVHGGTYHSILVNTPVHAHQDHSQEEHHHDGFFFLGDVSQAPHSHSHPPYDFEEDTYGFSVIKPSIVLESENPEFSHDLVVGAHAEILIVPRDLATSFSLAKIHFSILPTNVSSRAPPILLI